MLILTDDSQAGHGLQQAECLILGLTGLAGQLGNADFTGFRLGFEEREEDIELETFKVGEKVSIITIAPDPKKADKDISIPKLSPILTRKKSLAEEIAGLDVSTFNCPVLPRKQDDAAATKGDRARLQHSGAANG